MTDNTFEEKIQAILKDTNLAIQALNTKKRVELNSDNLNLGEVSKIEITAYCVIKVKLREKIIKFLANDTKYKFIIEEKL